MTTRPHIAATTTETRKARMITDHRCELLGARTAAHADTSSGGDDPWGDDQPPF